MEIAANSEGRADEQFAKYADTMEYRLNQLTTRWEEFRVNLLNQNVWKNGLDVVNEIIDRLNGLNLNNFGDVLKLVPSFGAMIIGLKNSFVFLFQTIAATKQNFVDYRAEINKLPEAYTNLRQTALQYYQAEGNNLKNQQREIRKTLKMPAQQQAQIRNQIAQIEAQLVTEQNKKIPKAGEDAGVKWLASYTAKIKNSNQSYRDVIQSLQTEMAKGGEIAGSTFAQNFKSAINSYASKAGVNKTAAIRALQQEAMNAVNGTGNFSNLNSILGIDSQLQQSQQIIDQYINKIRQLEQEEARLTQIVDQLKQKEEELGQKRATNAQSWENINKRLQTSQKVSTAVAFSTQMVTSAVYSLTTAIGGVASGTMKWTEAGKLLIGQLLTQAAVTATNIVSMRLLNNIQAYNNKLEAARVLLNVNATKSEIAAAGAVMTRAEAEAFLNMKLKEQLATMLGIDAALLGTIGIIAGVVAVVVGVAAVIYSVSKAMDEQAKAAKKLEEAQKKLNEAEEEYSRIKADAGDARKEYEDTKKLKEEWEEISSVSNQTTEEHEKQKELAAKIAEQFPEIVTYYNEITGELVYQRDLWEQILETQRKISAEKAYVKLGTGLAVEGQKREIAENQRDLDIAGAQNLQKDYVKLMQGYIDSTEYSIITDYLKNEGQDYLNKFNKYTGYNLSITDFYEKYVKTDFTLQGKSDVFADAFAQAIRNTYDNAWKTYDIESEKINKNEQILVKQATKDLNYSDAISTFIGYAIGKITENDIYDAAKPEVQKAIKNTKGTSYETLKEIGLEDYLSTDISEEDRKKKIYNQNEIIGFARAQYLDKYLDSLGELTEEQLKESEEFVKNLNSQTESQIYNSAAELKELFDDEQIKKGIESTRADALDSLVDLKHDFRDSFNSFETAVGEDFFTNATADSLSAWTESLKSIKAPSNKNQQAQEYAANLLKNVEAAGGTNLDAAEIIRNYDFSKLNALSAEETMKTWSKQIAEAYTSIDLSEATDLISQAYEDATAAGIVTPELNAGQIEEYVEQAKKLQNVLVDNYEVYSAFLEAGEGTVEVQAEQVKKLQDLFASLEKEGATGLDTILSIDASSGKATVNVVELNNLLNRYGADAVKNVKDQNKLEQERLEKLQKAQMLYAGNFAGDWPVELAEYAGKTKEEIDLMVTAQAKVVEAGKEQLEVIEEANSLYQQQIRYIQSVAYEIDKISGLEGNFSSLIGVAESDSKHIGSDLISALQQSFKYSATNIDYMEFFNKDLSVNVDKMYKALVKEIDAQLTSDKFKNEATQTEIFQMYALRQQIEDEYNAHLKKLAEEQQKLLEDAQKEEEKLKEAAEKAEQEQQKLKDAIDKAKEDLDKANEDYEKQLEAIADAQDALNEKIEDYNEVLYGSENRKSGLDLLYNYTEAINSFTKEVERAKDALADVESVEEATAALSNYTAATHQLLVEQKAEKIAIENSLSNMGAMIESGGTSYTNKETGETIKVNFGDYARKDQRTGLYMIDQKLLETARFNDEFKSLIEQNISDYNKYYEEYKEIDDSIKKEEKELREYRKTALNAYVTMENSVRDALKEAYEKEVEDVKTKYDQIKEADDDYLDALEDAINKQRKLREKESKWEKLAEKEKKYSLLSRDTSGANAVERRALEKELKESREEMLDSAIDDILSSIKELYESQEETREVEIELKEALIENTAYWNQQAESVAHSFTSTEDYMEYMANLSTEFADMTLAEQEQKLEEYRDEFAEATIYMAMTAMDQVAETGDCIEDALHTTQDEVIDVVVSTSEALSTEAQRLLDEVTDKFNEDLEKAEEEIQKAKDALAEAVEKLGELGEAAKAAAEEYENAKRAYDEYMATAGESSEDTTPTVTAQTVHTETPPDAVQAGEGKSETETKTTYTYAESAIINDYINKRITAKEAEEALKKAGFDKYYVKTSPFGNDKLYYDDEDGKPHIVKNSSVNAFATGGLVDYTGPAWVDGTKTNPEAFLSAEDTRRIGQLINVLSDIPFFNSYDSSTEQINTSIGDTSIEINLNIENLSSEIDVENMVNRIKDEIVSVANPVGLNTILRT